MNGLMQFLHMGGFAFYVWSSYGLALIVLIANAVLPVLCRRRVLREIRDHMEDNS